MHFSWSPRQMSKLSLLFLCSHFTPSFDWLHFPLESMLYRDSMDYIIFVSQEFLSVGQLIHPLNKIHERKEGRKISKKKGRRFCTFTERFTPLQKAEGLAFCAWKLNWWKLIWERSQGCLIMLPRLVDCTLPIFYRLFVLGIPLHSWGLQRALYGLYLAVFTPLGWKEKKNKINNWLNNNKVKAL